MISTVDHTNGNNATNWNKRKYKALDQTFSDL
jgi:hypothetical protein